MVSSEWYTVNTIHWIISSNTISRPKKVTCSILSIIRTCSLNEKARERFHCHLRTVRVREPAVDVDYIAERSAVLHYVHWTACRGTVFGLNRFNAVSQTIRLQSRNAACRTHCGTHGGTNGDTLSTASSIHYIHLICGSLRLVGVWASQSIAYCNLTVRSLPPTTVCHTVIFGSWSWRSRLRSQSETLSRPQISVHHFIDAQQACWTSRGSPSED